MTLSDRSLREQTLFHLYVNPPYDDTEKALRVALDQAVNKMYSTKGEWTRAKMVSVSKAIADNINKPYAGLLKTVQADVTAQINVASLFKVDRALVSELVNPDNLVQGYTMSDLFKTANDSHVKQLQVTFAAAVARGESVEGIAKALYAKNDKLTKNQLKSAIITTGNEARARLRHENYQKLEAAGVIDGYVYDATLDGRTTEYCRNHDGRIYHKDIKDIQNQINVHFRCRSVFRPYSPSVTTRASILGPTENAPYGQWFAKQDEDFKKATLGKMYKSYKNGDYTVAGVSELFGVLSMEQIKDLHYLAVPVTSGAVLSGNTSTAATLLATDVEYPLRDTNPTSYISGVRGERFEAFQMVTKSKAATFQVKHEITGKISTIHEVFVAKDYRQNNLFNKFMKTQIEFAKSNAYRTIYTSSNEDGLFHWLKLGFQPTNKQEFIDFIKTNYPTKMTYVDMWKAGDILAFTRMVNEDPTLRGKFTGKEFDLQLPIKNQVVLKYLDTKLNNF